MGQTTYNGVKGRGQSVGLRVRKGVCTHVSLGVCLVTPFIRRHYIRRILSCPSRSKDSSRTHVPTSKTVFDASSKVDLVASMRLKLKRIDPFPVGGGAMITHTHDSSICLDPPPSPRYTTSAFDFGPFETFIPIHDLFQAMEVMIAGT